jgi:hypothetical protein
VGSRFTSSHGWSTLCGVPPELMSVTCAVAGPPVVNHDQDAALVGSVVEPE